MDEFFQLHDNNVFIDWCIYNELIEDKSRNVQPEDQDTVETININKQLWNMFVIKYQIIKNKNAINAREDSVISELLKKIQTDFTKNT